MTRVSLGWVVVALTLGLLVAQTQAQSYLPREELKKPLSEAVEKVLVEFVAQCMVEKETQLTTHMEEVMKSVDAAVSLTPEEKAAMEPETKKAVAASVQAWGPEAQKALRTYFSRNTSSTANAARQINGWKAADVGAREPVEDWAAPQQSPAWLAALSMTIGAERFKQWEKARAAEDQKVEAEIKAYLERWVRESTGPMNEDLKARIGQMKTKLALPEKEVAALQQEAEALLARITQRERQRAASMLRPMPTDARKNIMGRTYFYLRFDRPRGEPWDKMWHAAAAKVLAQETMTQWDKIVADQRKKDEAELAEMIKPSEVYARQQMEMTMITEVDTISTELSMDKERQARLKKLSDAAVEEALKLGRKQWLEQVRNYTSTERKQMRANTYFGLNDESQAHSLPIWKEGLKKILTPEESTRMTQEKEQREKRCRTAISRACLAEMDQSLMLSTEQRAKLEPLVDVAMEPLMEQRRQQYWSYNPAQLFQSAGKIKEDAVRAVLDDVQWKRWKELVIMSPSSSRANAPPSGTPPATTDMEAAISQHFYKMFLAERKKSLGTMMPRVEEAARVLALPKEKVERLTTAAKGAVEKNLGFWRLNTERYVRQAVQTATPANILQALAGTERVSFGRTTDSDPTAEGVWKTALDDALDEPQMQRLKEVEAARRAYRLAAMAGMSVGELDRRRHLSAEQCAKLQPAVEKVLSDYQPDIERYMSGNWFLQYYYAMVPVAGVGQKEIEAILTPQQWKLCKERDLPDAMQYWEGIENNHKNRVKQAAKVKPNGGGKIVD